MSIYFPSDESNIGSPENVTCVDNNLSDISDSRYEISEGINSYLSAKRG